MDKKILIIVILLTLLSFGFSSNHTTIKIKNPFSISVKMLIKCDYDGKRYRINRVLKLNKKKGLILKIPQVRNCEIYPIDYKVFGEF